MPLNKSKGNMYPWVSATWNPIRGCQHNCIYCYVKSIYNYDMTPRYVQKYLSDDLYKFGMDSIIFVCSTGDMFGKWVPAEWIEAVLAYCRRFSHNTYLFQSKNPIRFLEFLDSFPMYSIFGTTIESNYWERFTVSQAPSTLDRMKAMCELGKGYDKMVSIEPIMDFDLPIMVDWIRAIKPLFVSIGADSKGHNLSEPTPQKICQLKKQIEQFTTVKIKSNLVRLW